MWYLSFEKHREEVLYEGETFQEIAEKMIGDGYGGEYLSGLEIRRDATPEELVQFCKIKEEISKNPAEIQKREYERRVESCVRPGLEWALERYKQELPYLSELGIQRAGQQAFRYLEERFSDLELPGLEEAREKYKALLQEEISKCHGV